jgi:hypothetical protein
MHNFELLFASRLIDGTSVVVERIVALPDLVWAQRVGDAMVGELIGDCQQLDSLVRAQRTTRELTLGQPLMSHLWVWLRVFLTVGLQPSQVKWVYNHHIGLTRNPRGHALEDVAQYEPEICGFRLFPDPEVAHAP